MKAETQTVIQSFLSKIQLPLPHRTWFATISDTVSYCCSSKFMGRSFCFSLCGSKLVDFLSLKKHAVKGNV